MEYHKQPILSMNGVYVYCKIALSWSYWWFLEFQSVHVANKHKTHVAFMSIQSMLVNCKLHGKASPQLDNQSSFRTSLQTCLFLLSSRGFELGSLWGLIRFEELRFLALNLWLHFSAPEAAIWSEVRMQMFLK